MSKSESIDDVLKAMDNFSNNARKASSFTEDTGFITKIKVSDSGSEALLDALYRAKESQDKERIQEIVNKIAQTHPKLLDSVVLEMQKRFSRNFVEKLFK